MNKIDNILVINIEQASSHNCRVANTYAKCSAFFGNCHFEDVFDTVEVCKHCEKHK